MGVLASIFGRAFGSEPPSGRVDRDEEFVDVILPIATHLETDGTFVNGASRRVQSPYQLADGDQLQVGDYVIAVSVTGLKQVRAASAAVATSPESPAAGGELWSNPTKIPPPISRQELLPETRRARREGDFLNEIAPLPNPVPDRAASASLWATTGVAPPAAAQDAPRAAFAA